MLRLLQQSSGIREVLTQWHSCQERSPIGCPRAAMRIDALKDSRLIPNIDKRVFENNGTRLFDLKADLGQLNPIQDAVVEQRLRAGIVGILRAHDAPHELYARYGLPIE